MPDCYGRDACAEGLRRPIPPPSGSRGERGLGQASPLWGGSGCIKIVPQRFGGSARERNKKTKQNSSDENRLLFLSGPTAIFAMLTNEPGSFGLGG